MTFGRRVLLATASIIALLFGIGVGATVYELLRNTTGGAGVLGLFVGLGAFLVVYALVLIADMLANSE